MSTKIVIGSLFVSALIVAVVGVVFLVQLTWQVLRTPRVRNRKPGEFIPTSGERFFR